MGGVGAEEEHREEQQGPSLGHGGRDGRREGRCDCVSEESRAEEIRLRKEYGGGFV